AGRVVATVLEALEAFDQDGNHIAIRDRTNDAAHGREDSFGRGPIVDGGAIGPCCLWEQPSAGAAMAAMLPPGKRSRPWPLPHLYAPLQAGKRGEGVRPDTPGVRADTVRAAEVLLNQPLAIGTHIALQPCEAIGHPRPQ